MQIILPEEDELNTAINCIWFINKKVLKANYKTKKRLKEHLLQEVKNFSSYKKKDLPLSFGTAGWRWIFIPVKNERVIATLAPDIFVMDLAIEKRNIINR